MKERITYILRDPEAGFNPSRLEVTDSSFGVLGVNAAKELSITFSFGDLPHEIWMVLKNCHEMHLRWASERAYDSIAPYTARTPPGLHVFYTPLKGMSAEGLCPLLQKLFSSMIKCSTAEVSQEAFITPPILSQRFSISSARQYYQISAIDGVIIYIQHKLCDPEDVKCQFRALDLAMAEYVDIDYDSISHTLTIKAFWTRSSVGDGTWWEDHQKVVNDSIEVGVLMNEYPDSPEELRYSGWLTVIGKDKKSSQTLFSFPARHHLLPPLDAYFSASFKEPTGMHPVLQLSLSDGSLQPPADTCALHAYLTLPSYLFIDKYQLSDPLFVASQNLKAIRALSGATDLEAPDWVIKEWGSAALLEIATPDPRSMAQEWNVSIPMHLRYLSPGSELSGARRSVSTPWPTVFWACVAEEGSKFVSSPFDRINLGYDGLFGPKTMFYHVPPAKDSVGYANLEVPVLDLSRSSWVETGTVVVITSGTLWVLWKLLQAVLQSSEREHRVSKKKTR